MRCGHVQLVSEKSTLYACGEARGSLVPPLSRNERDHAEYLQSPKELCGGEDPFSRHANMLPISAIFALLPLWPKVDLPLDVKSKETTG